jgi:hypothetical protein
MLSASPGYLIRTMHPVGRKDHASESFVRFAVDNIPWDAKPIPIGQPEAPCLWEMLYRDTWTFVIVKARGE